MLVRRPGEARPTRDAFVVRLCIDVYRVREVCFHREAYHLFGTASDHGSAAHVSLQSHQVAPQLAIQHHRRVEQAVEAERGGREA